MRTPWGESISIYLFPSSDFFDVVKQQFDGWMLERLVQPSIWVSPEDLDFEARPPLIRCKIHGLDLDGTILEKEEILTDVLAQQELRRVRVVSLFALGNQIEISDADIQAMDKCVELIRLSLPQAVNSDDGVTTEFLAVNLIVAPTGYSVESFVDRAKSVGRVTVVASAEDHSTPWAADAQIRDDERFPIHVAAQLASVGGSWNGVADGVFDVEGLLRKDAAYVARSQVTAILTDGLARRIAAKTLEDLANPESTLHSILQGLPIPGHPYIPDSAVDDEIQRMIELTFAAADGAMSFRDPAELAPPPQSNFGLLSSIKDFLKFSFEKIKSLPYWLYRYVRHSIEYGVWKRLFKEDGTVAPPMEVSQVDPSEIAILQQIQQLEQSEQLAKQALVAPFRAGAEESFPQLWRAIRRIVFGKLDGSDFQDLGGEPAERIFDSVGRVIQDPNADVPLDERVAQRIGLAAIDWNSLDRTDEVLAAYQEVISELQARLQQNLAWLVQADEWLAQQEQHQQELAAAALLPEVPVMAEPAPEPSPEPEALQADAQDLPDLDPAEAVSDLEDSHDAEGEPAAADLPEDLHPASATYSSLKSAPQDQEAEVLPAEVAPAPEAVPAAVVTPVATDEQVAEYRQARDRVLAENSDLDMQIDELSLAQQDLQRWRDANQRSYLWHLLETSDKEIERATAKLAEYERKASGVERPDPGVLNKLREDFLKVSFGSLMGLLVAGAIYAIVALTGGSGALAAAAILLVLRYFGPPAVRNVTAGKRFKAGIFVLLLIAVLALVSKGGAVFAAMAAWLLALNWAWVAFGFALSILTTALAALLPYYSRWNKLRRDTELKLFELSQVAENVQVVRKEADRLKKIGTQVRDWLFIIGMSLNHPWQIDDRWHHSNELELVSDRMPHSLRFALVHEQDTPEIAELGRKAAEQFVRSGWRSDIFAEQLDAIVKVNHLPSKLLSVETLDNDISYSPSGPRQLAYTGLQDPTVLNLVARREIQKMLAYIQLDAMREATPPVFEPRLNPFKDILDDAFEVQDEFKMAWDEFLSVNIPPTRATPPLSLDAFVTDRIAANPVHTQLQTIVLGPERLLDRLDAQRFHKLPYKTKERLPVDIVIRIDVTRDVPPELLRVTAPAGKPRRPTDPDQDGKQGPTGV